MKTSARISNLRRELKMFSISEYTRLELIEIENQVIAMENRLRENNLSSEPEQKELSGNSGIIASHGLTNPPNQVTRI